MSNYTYHGTRDLIALPGRSVQTFPSGLVRVERSFMCRKDDVARYRNTFRVNEPMPFDDGAPAIDGLYIFPDPQEQVRDDGFVEFRVTAYGRTNVFSEVTVEKSSALGTYNFFVEKFPVADSTDLNRLAINDLFIIRGVLPSSASTASILQKPNIANPTVIDIRSQRPLEPTDIIFPGIFEINEVEFKLQRIVSIGIVFDSYSSTNFGRWAEYVIAWRAQGSDATLFIIA
jgi:hypothetical protein